MFNDLSMKYICCTVIQFKWFAQLFNETVFSMILLLRQQRL